MLKAFRRPPLQRMTDLYAELHDNILATYEELDHFGPRAKARYWGHWAYDMGKGVNWPAGAGTRIFAYLKPFPELDLLLQTLGELGQPTLIFGQGFPGDLIRKHARPHLRFESEALNLPQVASECDLAIINGNHGTGASLLLAGKPCLLLPLFMEQLIFAKKAEQMGAGRALLKSEGAKMPECLREMLRNSAYRTAAQGFARRYEGFRPGQQLAELATRMEQAIQRRN